MTQDQTSSLKSGTTSVSPTGSVTGDRLMPGDPTRTDFLAQIIRVDQAGEYGAVRIYEGQMAVLRRRSCAPQLSHMTEQ